MWEWVWPEGGGEMEVEGGVGAAVLAVAEV